MNRPYNGVMQEYESVQVETPPFDTLRLDIHMSEPDYNLGIDQERISTLEALQEDTFYSTENFVNMMGDLEAGSAITYAGRIIPIVHASEDGKDGHVRIEFYGKPAGNPMVELRRTDAAGKRHEQKRDLWPLNGAIQPRLVAARVAAGEPGPRSLTWLLPADFKDDSFDDWVKLEGQEQVVRSILPVEQGTRADALAGGDAYGGLVSGRDRIPACPRIGNGVRASAAALGEDRFGPAERERSVRPDAAADGAPRDRGPRRQAAAAATGAMGRAHRSRRERGDSGQVGDASGRERVLDGTELSGAKLMGGRCGTSLPRATAFVGEGDHAQGIDRLLRKTARQRSLQHQSHFEAGGRSGERCGDTGAVEAGERGVASHHQPGWSGALGATGRDHAQ